MEETKGLLDKISHHDKLSIMINENCAIDLPENVLQQLLQPHKLSFYYFVFIDQGSAIYHVDSEHIILSGNQMVFGLPNQIFTNPRKKEPTLGYKIALDEHTLSLLPHAYPFLLNPLNSNAITFEQVPAQRVKAVFSILFQLLHASGEQKPVELILAYLNTLLTEINSAYFAQAPQDRLLNPKLSKYVAFKLAVETHLTEQQDVHTIAEQLSMTTSSLYGVVKEYSGLSPKEWMTNRLIMEARRKLQYTTISVKELAYELGFNDPDYFSRVFKKSTGKSVSEFLAELHDLSGR